MREHWGGNADNLCAQEEHGRKSLAFAVHIFAVL